MEKENFVRDNMYGTNFRKCNTKKYGCKPTRSKYDINSIMHYKPTLTTVNDNTFTVITPNDGSCENGECNMGQREQLSVIDIQDINEYYDCSPIGKIFWA